MAHLRQIVVLLIVNAAVFGKDHRFVEEPISVKDDKFGGTRLSYTDKAGRVVTEHVILVGNGDRQFIILPKQKLSDRATVYHNKQGNFTVYKDHTYGQCFLSELQPNVFYSRFVLVKYNATQDDSDENVIQMESYGQPIQNIEDVVDDSTVTGLCAGLVVRTVKPVAHKNRVRRELTVAVSCPSSSDCHTPTRASFGEDKPTSAVPSKGDGGRVTTGRGGVKPSRSSNKGGASSSSSSRASDTRRNGGSSRNGGGRNGGGRRGGW